MSGSTRIFEWAQPVSGSYDEAGAWLVGGVATQDVPTAADDVIFDTGSAAPYTVSGGGSAANLTAEDSGLTLTGTFTVAGTVDITSVATALALPTIFAGLVDINVGNVTLSSGGDSSSGDAGIPPGQFGYDDPSPFDGPVIAASNGNSITVTSPPPSGTPGAPTVTTTTFATTGGTTSAIGETISGGFAGAQLFAAPTAPTLMFAGPGTEMLVAAGGSDTLVGGGSGDMMFGGSGASTLFGAAGGGDTMVGGSGSSVLVLQPGDAGFGGTGTTTIFGAASGADTLGAGPAGATLMVSEGASDTFIGNAGASTVFTGGGSATVFTGPGQMLVVEGSGADKVIAGSGAATVFAGAGTDLFDFTQGSGGGGMMIADFAGGRDRIELFGYDAAAARQQAASGATSLSLSDGTTISFPALTHLDPSWIV